MGELELIATREAPQRGPQLALVGLHGGVLDDVRTVAPPGWVEVACDPHPRGSATRVAPLRPDALLVYAGPDGTDAMAELAEYRRLVPSCRVMVLSPSKDPDRILRAMREGAAEYIVLPEDLGELARSLADIGPSASADRRGTSRVIAVVGARGGVGTTTCAVHLAGELNARRPSRVALVDVNPVAPDIGVFLDVDLSFSLLDVMRNVHRMDDDLLNGVMNRHSTGLAVLALPEEEDARAEVARLGAGAPLRALEALCRSFEATVLDCGSVPDPFTSSLIAVADSVLLVVQPDLPSVKNALRRLAWFRAAGVAPDAVQAVVNLRNGRSARLRTADLAESLGVKVVAELPADGAVATALDDGGVLAGVRGRSSMRRELQRLADAWIERPARRHRWFPLVRRTA